MASLSSKFSYIIYSLHADVMVVCFILGFFNHIQIFPISTPHIQDINQPQILILLIVELLVHKFLYQAYRFVMEIKPKTFICI